MPTKPHADACDRNRQPILEIIQPLLSDCCSVLEIGSGTGQHAVYFAGQLPHLHWQTSERQNQHEAIRLWLDEAALDNLQAPLSLDVLNDPWPDKRYDAVFSANTAHIMSWAAVSAMFQGVGQILNAAGLFMLYGPFSHHGRHNSDSNRAFDQRLQARDPAMGIRDIDELMTLADHAGLRFVREYAMPANNRILLWQRV